MQIDEIGMAATSGKRILIVEDDDDIVELIMIVVGEEENQLDIASNGSEALAKIRANGNYDLIISDYHMPLMDGVRLLSEIRSIDTTLAERMFFISGEPVNTDLDGFGSRRIRFLLKPFGIKELRQHIEDFFKA